MSETQDQRVECDWCRTRLVSFLYPPLVVETHAYQHEPHRWHTPHHARICEECAHAFRAFVGGRLELSDQ